LPILDWILRRANSRISWRYSCLCSTTLLYLIYIQAWAIHFTLVKRHSSVSETIGMILVLEIIWNICYVPLGSNTCPGSITRKPIEQSREHARNARRRYLFLTWHNTKRKAASEDHATERDETVSLHPYFRVTSGSAINLLIVATLPPSFPRWSADGAWFLPIHVALRERLRGLQNTSRWNASKTKRHSECQL
jgi:hypothetical protein